MRVPFFARSGRLRELLDGSADHLTYEDDLEGLGSAREAALEFLLERLAG